MRLQGGSDVTYRAYDLLSPERGQGDVVAWLRAAGQYVPSGQTANAVGILQARFVAWGFPILSIDEVKTMLHEFWVYDRIKRKAKKNWPFRNPDEARKLYAENEALRASQKKLDVDGTG
jgi:hypothetical protein